MSLIGFVRLIPLWPVHVLTAVPSHAMGDCFAGGCDQASCAAIAQASASELIQREVEVRQIHEQILTTGSGIQHAVARPPALSELDGGKVNVTPYECSQPEALQSTTGDDEVTKIQKLNVTTGEYTDVLTVPNGWTDPEFRSINSCAISPVDGIIHCSMEIDNRGSFLVRIDMTQVAFVAKMPPWCYAATFDKDGNYWMSKSGALSVIKDVASMPSYSSYSYLSGGEPALVSIPDLGADMVVMYGDLEKSGNEGTYLLSLKQEKLQVVKVSTEPYEKFSLTNTSGLPGQGVVWGSAWNFQNSIFFSGDNGVGVFRLDSFDAQNGAASFVLMGPAQHTDWNDGLSCVGKGTPWEPDVVSYDCKDDWALQAITTNMSVPTTDASRTYFKHLDVSTGTYQLFYEVHKNWTDPPFNSINSCAVNPVDNVIHCTMEIDNKGSFLVRIDKTQVGFVAKVPGWMYSGVFDTDGTYYMYGNGGLSYMKQVAGMPAFSSYSQLGNVQAYNGPYKLAKGGDILTMGADMVVLRADWEGTGFKTYLLSVESNTLSVVQASDGDPFAQWTLVANGLPGEISTWGSAWNFKNQTFFHPDSGEDIYELMVESVELESGTAQFKKAGKSEDTGWNDGFSCICDPSPFKVVS